MKMVESNGNGYVLISENPLLYGDKCVVRCKEGHLIETSWRDMKNKIDSNKFCNNCYMLNKMNERAIEKDYTLLSKEWKGYTESYNFLCPNKHEQIYIWKYFNDHEGNHCSECYNQRVLNGEHNATSEEFKQLQTKKLFDRMVELGYTLNQENYSYNNNKDKIKMKCQKNHDYQVEYSHFMQGKSCRKCGYDKWRLSEEEVQTELKSMGYVYVGEYHRVDEPLKYVCTCGHVARKRLVDLRKGQKCMRCSKRQNAEKRRQERVSLLEQEFGIK